MRVVVILGALAVIARIMDSKPLGLAIFLFILACSLFGVGETITDLFTRNSTLTKKGRRNHLRRYLESLPPNFNPRYANLRSRGVSHKECLRRGQKPIRDEDWLEQDLAKNLREYEARFGKARGSNSSGA